MNPVVGATAAAAVGSMAASAQGAGRPVHGNWQIRSETPPGARVLLSAWLGIKIDQVDIGRALFVHAEVVMDDA